MDKIQALNAFWNQFGLIAYDASSVPSGAPYPYITYDVSISDFDEPVQENVSIWYRDTSWANATRKMDEIGHTIGRGGVMLPYEGGAIWLTKGSNFAQRMSDEDDTIKRYVLQVMLEYME